MQVDTCWRSRGWTKQHEESFSNLAMAQQVVRKFRESRTRGRIVFVSSMGGMLTA